jgi:hypothetical protein
MEVLLCVPLVAIYRIIHISPIFNILGLLPSPNIVYRFSRSVYHVFLHPHHLTMKHNLRLKAKVLKTRLKKRVVTCFRTVLRIRNTENLRSDLDLPDIPLTPLSDPKFPEYPRPPTPFPFWDPLGSHALPLMFENNQPQFNRTLDPRSSRPPCRFGMSSPLLHEIRTNNSS